MFYKEDSNQTFLNAAYMQNDNLIYLNENHADFNENCTIYVLLKSAF